MTRLYWTLARAGGWPRVLLLAACTAVVSGLLLVAVALLLLPSQPQEQLSNLVADTGVRGGTTFAIVLLTVPALLLMHQSVRLGTTSRERRLAALRLAGATTGQVRVLGAIEVGLPSLVGGLLGIGVYATLRAWFGGRSFADATSFEPTGLVPITVQPAWWQVLIVVAVVTLLGVLVGALVSRSVTVTPLGVTRRQQSAPPRPWGLLLMLLAVLVTPAVFLAPAASTVVGICIVGLAVAGIAGLAPWVAHRAGRLMVRRGRSASMVLAAARLVAEPRAAGRAAAAVGGIALVSGGSAAIGADLLAMEFVDSLHTRSLLMIGIALTVALVVVAWTLAVHTVESLLDHRRSTAALAAGGASLKELERAQRLGAALCAVPLAVAGSFLGAVPLGLVVDVNMLGVLLMAADIVVTPALVWVAIVVAVRMVRPWTLRAAHPGNLRTE